MRRLFRAFLLCIFAALICLCSGCVSEPQKEDEENEETECMFTQDDFLTVKGNALVNQKGETVLLRGVNLGGWLIQECWMTPVAGEDGEWGNLDTIQAFEAAGFTAEQIQTLFETYQNNWITEYDLDIIREAGVNCVRVPFWYRNFMTDEAGTWIEEDLDENPGFEKLDWVIREAGKRGLYVILDMHGCPGGQSMNHCCGTVGRKDLYTSDTCRAAMKKLWLAIAERYKDNPIVAAYDIMNEPQNNNGFQDKPNYLNEWSSEAWNETNGLYREMIAAVRTVDAKHVISVEGIWRVRNLPYPKDEGWTNMLYQLHLYDSTPGFTSLCKDLAIYGAENEVAVYVGEFSNMDGIGICEEYNVNWTTWSYKGGKGEIGDWFWYSAAPTPVVPGETSYEEALQLWGEALRTENGFQANEHVLDTVRAAIGAE
ncbi:MAG: cellulase family glycosylhydrolase [Clostridia bacterium]|nr:cellulase family glycosylhydrolase [Clostridia bacterium]